LKEDFVPRKERTYLMSRQEKEKVQEFIKEQLREGYIRPSKLPQTSLVFFVGKKDEKKRMVQDYQYLNKGTVKDNYSLPLNFQPCQHHRDKKGLYKNRPIMGLQQCTGKRRRQVEGSVHNTLRGLQTHCYVLWSHKLASNLSGNDE